MLSNTSLFRAHVVALLAHAATCVVILVQTNDMRIPLQWTVPTESDYTISKTLILFDYDPVYFVAVYTLVSALEHALCLIFFDLYVSRLFVQRKPDLARWFSYSLSAPTMMVHMVTLCGQYEFLTLGCVFMLMHICMWFGYVSERLFFIHPYMRVPDTHVQIHAMGSDELESASTYTRTDNARWVTWFGCVPYIAAWLVLFISFFRAVAIRGPPNFVIAIVVGEFIVMNVFGMVTLFMVYSKWPFDVDVERRVPFAFLLLSLTAKLFLAYVNLYGTLSRTRTDSSSSSSLSP